MDRIAEGHLETRRAKGNRLRWYDYVAYFFGGAFLARTPYPIRQWSRAMLSRAPSLFTTRSGIVFLEVRCCRVYSVPLQSVTCSLFGVGSSICDLNIVLVLGAGILLISLVLAHTFGRFHGGL